MPEPFIAESQAKVGEECIAIDTYGKLKWSSSQFDGLPLKLIVSEDYSKKYLDTPSSQHILWTGIGKKGVDLPWVKEMLNLYCYREGYQYKRAGVIVGRISRSTAIQQNIFDKFTPEKRNKMNCLSKVIYTINSCIDNSTMFSKYRRD